MMTDAPATALDLAIQPLTAERWPDLEALFGPRGACGGCWCMWWRLRRSEFEQQKGEANRHALQAIVESGAMPGLLGYQGEQPVAWVAIAPRESYPVLERSRNLKRIDDAPVWSITCLFVARPFRRRARRAGRRADRRGLPDRAADRRGAGGVRLDRPGLGVPPGRLRRGAEARADPADHAL